ncbi:MAG: response regulator [Chthoniobacterales bacterium]
MHILLVEDHDDTRLVLSKLLFRCGHDVSDAANVRDALLLLDHFLFDVLVSDIGLPDGNGLDLVAEAKRRQGFRITVALTALASAADHERGHQAGFDHYLTKPFDFGKLRSLLHQAA